MKKKKGNCLLAACRAPCKHDISCQYRVCTGPMREASAPYRPGTGTSRNVYGDDIAVGNKVNIIFHI